VGVIGVAAFIVVNRKKSQPPEGSQRCTSFTK